MDDRYRGCLLGGAVGDALGAPVEFLSLNEILQKFGPGGIRDFARVFGRVGAITDDTQMTLFTAEGLLRAYVRACLKGIGPVYESVTANAYLRWLRTQGEQPAFSGALPPEDPEGCGWLMTHRELFERRVPGATCLAALRTMPHLGAPAVNHSKGCGGVMRVAPVGLFVPRIYEGTAIHAQTKAFELGANLAGLTHGHPTGRLAAGAFAMIVAALVQGAALPRAMAAAQSELRSQPDFEETFNAIARAARLAASEMPPDAAIRELGAGWVAEEALAIALYCALVGETFEGGVILAVNHDGDSDSTGSIAGNLLGLIHGERAIPRRWLKGLELREVIAEIASDLATCKD